MAKRAEWKRISNKIRAYKQVLKLTSDLREAHKYIVSFKYSQKKSALNSFLLRL